MSYTFTLPKSMRVFRHVSSISKRLYLTDDTLSLGEIVKLKGVAVMSYDHHDKLTLLLHHDDRYLLVEEIDEQIRELAFRWALHHEAGARYRVVFSAAEENKKAVEAALAPLMRRYIESEDRPIARFDKEGPGINFVLCPYDR